MNADLVCALGHGAHELCRLAKSATTYREPKLSLIHAYYVSALGFDER